MRILITTMLWVLAWRAAADGLLTDWVHLDTVTLEDRHKADIPVRARARTIGLILALGWWTVLFAFGL